MNIVNIAENGIRIAEQFMNFDIWKQRFCYISLDLMTSLNVFDMIKHVDSEFDTQPNSNKQAGKRFKIFKMAV